MLRQHRVNYVAAQHIAAGESSLHLPAVAADKRLMEVYLLNIVARQRTDHRLAAFLQYPARYNNVARRVLKQMSDKMADGHYRDVSALGQQTR